jgi:hypothetical protein
MIPDHLSRSPSLLKTRVFFTTACFQKVLEMKTRPFSFWAAVLLLTLELAHASDPKLPPAVALAEPAEADTSSRISWQTFQAIPLAQVVLAPREGRIVFIRRGPQQESATPSGIYVNGRFHTAVLPGAYAQSTELKLA